MKNLEDSYQEKPGIAGVFYTFLKLGLTAFGGPIAHIGYFRKELVERQRWISEGQFSQLLAICQFLPGPASSQLGFTLGLLRAGWLGAFAAFLAFTLPSAFLLIGFASLLPALSGVTAIAAIQGLKLVACAVVADAVIGMARNLCPDMRRRGIAVVATSTLLVLDAPWTQILVVGGGALAGALLCRIPSQADIAPIPQRLGKSFGLALFGIALFLLAISLTPAAQSGLLSIASTFYRAGALVFGGGHVVLPLLEESVVATAWISEEAFLAGYGAAQVIPGPLFAFSAYLGALIPTDYPSYAGAGAALLCMFLPGFLLVSASLPLWQYITSKPAARNAIAGVNAVVVGLLAAALYDPVLSAGINSLLDLSIALIGLTMLQYWRLSPLWVVCWCLAGSILAASL